MLMQNINIDNSCCNLTRKYTNISVVVEIWEITLTIDNACCSCNVLLSRLVCKELSTMSTIALHRDNYYWVNCEQCTLLSTTVEIVYICLTFLLILVYCRLQISIVSCNNNINVIDWLFITRYTLNTTQ